MKVAENVALDVFVPGFSLCRRSERLNEAFSMDVSIFAVNVCL